MKKINFPDKYGLTQAVLDGRKTMTRRIAHLSQHDADVLMGKIPTCPQSLVESIWLKSRYKVNEVVAIAQSYSDCGNMPDCEFDEDGYPIMPKRSGFFNKMLVKSDLMPHHIKITGIKVERLQDISDEDCLKEGIIHACTNNDGIKIYHTSHTKKGYLSTDVAQRAFEFLINKVSGKGTWESNPYVFCYEFALID